MEPKKIVKLCAIIVSCTVLFICTFSFGSDEEITLLTNAYNKTTQSYNRTSVSTVINNLEQENQMPATPGINDNPNSTQISVDTSSWLKVCDSVHKQWGAAGLTYVYGGRKTITKADGTSVDVRTDCSGYVSYCLYSAGYSTSTTGFSSSSDFSSAGFTLTQPPNGTWQTSDLVPGDIVTWPGKHVQIYAGPNDDWYNWGSASSCQNKYTNVTDINSVDSQVHSLTAHDLAKATVYRAPSN